LQRQKQAKPGKNAATAPKWTEMVHI